MNSIYKLGTPVKPVPVKERDWPRGSLGEPLYRFPATVAQQTFWLLHSMEGGNPAWNIAVRFKIRGRLDIPALARALNELPRRHEILRTTFALVDRAPMQIVHASAIIPLPGDDLSRVPQPQRDVEEERRTIIEGAHKFDLGTGPLIRARILRLAEEEHVLIMTVHHIVSDGWSIGVFSDEVAANYQALMTGTAPALPELAFQFADYAVWQAECAKLSATDENKAYWKQQLANLPLLEIPPNHPRPAVKTNNGYILSTVLPVGLTSTIEEFSHQHECTLYLTAVAALNMLIRHHARQNDVYIGTLLAGRDRIELEPMFGLFINTIVLRTSLAGDPTFVELLDRVRNTFEAGLAHQDLHFSQIVEAARPKRDPSRPTLYSINFIYQRDFVKPLEFCGLTMEPMPSKSPGAIYDLNFFMVRRSDGWRLSCEYNYDLYDGETISLLIGQLRNLLVEIAKNPNRRISEFPFPADVGEALPPLVPHTHLDSNQSASPARA